MFENASSESLRNLRSFDTQTISVVPSARFVFDQTGVDPDTGEPFPSTGVLEAGTYRFGASGSAINPGFDEGSFELTNFGIVLLDSTLTSGETDPPVAIPSPAALPAGLALLGAGLMRRRRDAEA